MNHSQLIDELLQELSYRVGIPNIYNKEHQSIMSEILTEWGEFEAKETIFNFLNEADEENKNDDRYVSVGFGRFKLKGKEDEGDPTYEKDDSGNYVKLSGDEEAPADEKPKKPLAQDVEYQKVVAKEKETRAKINGKSEQDEREKEIEKNLSAKEKRTRRGILKRLDTDTLKRDWPETTDDEVEHINNFRNLVDEFLNPQTSDERKREIALELKNTYDLATNMELVDEDGNPKTIKIYIRKNADGGKVPRQIEKILGEPNAASTDLANQLNSYLDEETQIRPKSIGGKNERGVKQEFETAAKPSFSVNGKKNPLPAKKRNPLTKGKKEDPNNPGHDKDGNPLLIEDPLVSQIFKKGTVLGDLKESMHSLEGPADDDGNLIPCDSPENKRKHFDFLINNNESNQKVRQLAQKYINDPSVSESDKEKFRNIVNAIDEYEAGMKSVVDKIPSEEAEAEVKRLNAKLMDDLHNAYPEIASGMAKQFAENAVVTQEIAVGDEVYMPSQGTFPGGDKIVVTRNGAAMEAVAGVSVKFGRASKNTQIYGFPGEAQSMANFAELERRANETDEQFEERKQDVRTRNGKYVGQDGYLLGVRDDIANDENKFNEILTQSGLDEAVTDKKKLHELNKEIYSEIERYIEEQRKLGRSDKAIRISLQKHMNDWMKENNIQNRFEECIDRSKLTEQMTGSTDGRYTDEDGNEQKHDNTNLAQGCTPLEFMGIASFASSVKEGKGMPSLLWNHQSYEDGEYHSETTNPDDTDMTDLSNWGFSSRLWATSSRDGGGILATGTGEGKRKQKALKNTEDK